MFNQKPNHAAKITAAMMLVVSLGFYIVLQKSAPSPMPVVTPTETAVPATTTSTSTATATLTMTPVPTHTPTVPPTATATLTPVPTQTPELDHHEKARKEYPELVARVDKALDSLVIEFQPPIRNESDTGWLFPWQLKHFSPPVLDGVKGGEVYAPNRLPYQLVLIFNIHPVGSKTTDGVFKVGVTDGQAEVLDTDLPAGSYEFSMAGWYHSRAYSQQTEWMPWQEFQVK